MVCKNCGFESEGAAFCTRCGARLEDAPAPQETVSAPVTPETPSVPEAPPSPTPAVPTPAAPPVPVPPNPAYAQPPMPPQPAYAQQPAPPAIDPGSGKGTASLVLGIVALALGTICSCLLACLGGAIPLTCAIVGIVLGKQAETLSAAEGFENKKAKAGVILSIVAIVIIVIFILLNAVLSGIIASSSLWEELAAETYY